MDEPTFKSAGQQQPPARRSGSPPLGFQTCMQNCAIFASACTARCAVSTKPLQKESIGSVFMGRAGLTGTRIGRPPCGWTRVGGQEHTSFTVRNTGRSNKNATTQSKPGLCVFVLFIPAPTNSKDAECSNCQCCNLCKHTINRDVVRADCCAISLFDLLRSAIRHHVRERILLQLQSNIPSRLLMSWFYPMRSGVLLFVHLPLTCRPLSFVTNRHEST